MRYIDADTLMQEDFSQMWNDITDQSIFEHIIEQTPTAEVIEVVRCKDCKLRETSGCPMYREEYSEWDDDGYTEVDLIVTDLTEDEGFCHCGTKIDKERK